MKFLKTAPQPLYGFQRYWYRGWALDMHTQKVFHASGIVRRTELGEAMFQLKYRNGFNMIEPVGNTIVNFLKSAENYWWFRHVSTIIPAPPSKNRVVQPVFELAKWVAPRTGLTYDDNYVIKYRETGESKNLVGPVPGIHHLERAFSVRAEGQFSGKTVLVLDDVFGTGTTLGAVCKTLYEQGNAWYVYALAVTKTRKSR